MNSLKNLSSKIKSELKLYEAEEDYNRYGEDEEDLEADVERKEEVASGVIMRINNDTKINANIKNLEFEIYYSDLARVLTDDERTTYTFTRQKARDILEIILEEMGFFVSSEEASSSSSEDEEGDPRFGDETENDELDLEDDEEDL